MRPCRIGIIMTPSTMEEEEEEEEKQKEPSVGLPRPIMEHGANTLRRINNTTRTCYHSLLTLRDIIQDEVDRQLRLDIINPYLISANNTNTNTNNINNNNNNNNNGKKSGIPPRAVQQSSG
ncbi:hypothetical protein BGZ96_010173 [Linnemannia gamsii]|uniref:Uncharacterized protein n=1 Tax=Linnemannia gamsii TaxID=64522 RepID=A0ABQ7JWP7_9FUNG|nr:hypothetical protein BGZ96_010173 [Linnemannia gamsii]